MPAQVHLLDPSACLISALIEDLAGRSREELEETMILLPTQRLGTYLLTGLLLQHRALIPPRILTLENLLQQEAPRDRRVIADSGIDLLLGRLIAEGHYTHLHPGHERELRLLHSELYDHGLRESALEKLKTAIREDIYKSEPHLGSLYDRAVEIEHILSLLDMVLEERGLCTRAAQLALSAQSLAARWPNDPVPARHYVIAAYTSIATSWQTLLETWLGEERFAFWLSQAPPLYHPSSPLKELVQRIEKLAPTLRRYPASAHRSHLLAASAPSFVDEARWALEGAQQLIAQGFAPEKVAILVTDESSYGVPLAAQLETLSLPCNLALTRPWASSLPGRCLHALEQFWQERESLPTLLALLDQPLIERALATRLGWTNSALPMAALKEALLHSGVPAALDRAIKSIPALHRPPLEVLRELLAPLHPQAVQPLGSWMQALAAWVETMDLWSAAEDRDVLNSCREGFEHFVETLRLLADAGQPLEGRVFWQLFKRHLLETDIRRTGEPLSGLQIIILSEARYFPFQAVFLLGCQEGSFPKGLPQDELLDNYLKKAMGLPGWETLEAMEDQTFHLLKARVPHLTFLRAERKGEEALVRSRFIEAMVVKQDLIEQSLPACPRRELNLDQAEVFTFVPEGVLTLSSESLRTHMSASRLERFLRCPYAFLLDSLDVRGLETPPPWGDSRREGEWLHGILEALVSGMKGMHRLIEPWQVHQKSDIAREALARLQTLTLLLAPPELRESALMQHLSEHAWPRFAAHLAQLYSGHAQALQESKREYNFQGKGRLPAEVEVAGQARYLKGRIDAIDPHPHWVAVTDYKRRTIPSLKEGREGAAPQLGFYALALSALEPTWKERGLLLGYWNIYQGLWHPQAVSQAARERAAAAGLIQRDTDDLETLKTSLLELWSWREEDVVREARYYADPGQCKLCNYSGICRKEDPRVRDRIKSQAHLLQKRQGGSHEDPS